jgi:hypothetical protein
MISSHVRRGVGALMVAMFAANVHSAAVDTPKRSDGTKSTPAAQRPSTSKSGAGRGVLPDPALLDGSTATPEKKTEHGMIGEFELPGDENVRNGKVGGPQNQPPGGGANPPGMPQAGGGGPQLPAGGKAGQQAGGGQPPPAQQNANGPGGDAASGAGDPNAKAEGIQVAELGGEPSGSQPAGGGEKPPPVAIGDKAMRIQTSANAPGVVGSQQQTAPNTQQHEKGTGSGGKGPTGGSGSNKVEKGRTIPAGL